MPPKLPSDSETAVRALLDRIVAVIVKTAKWANTHQAESGQILAKYAKAIIQPGMSRVTYAEKLDPAQVQPFINAGAKYGMLKAPFPATELLR